MGQYTCRLCNKPRHAAEHGFSTIRVKDENDDRCYCDECFDTAIGHLIREDVRMELIQGEDALDWLDINGWTHLEPPSAPRPPKGHPEDWSTLPWPREDVAKRYIENTVIGKFPAFISGGYCRECGCDMFHRHAAEIMNGAYHYTGCERCGRSYCD